MLRIMRQGSRWIMAIVIVAVGAVFVLYLGIGGGFGRAASGPQTVVAVGGRQFDSRDVLRRRQVLEQEYRRVLGEGFDPEQASDYLDQMAAGALLRFAILAEEAERMGLRVSDAEIREYLRALPGAAGEDGRLDKDVVSAYAEREFGSVRRFQEALRDELLARKAARLISESVDISDAEALASLRYQRTAVRLAVVKLDATGAPEDLEVSDEQVTALLADEPETVRHAYEKRADEFDQPERVRARHILIRVPEEADEAAVAEAHQRIEDVRKRIADGADFADVAMELSEDPGSKAEGGDLGFFARGRMVKEFDEVAFALEPGVLSDVVRSPYGFHLIRVEEKKPASIVPLEEARREVARDLLRERAAREAAQEQADALAAAVRAGTSLVEAARERGLAIDRPDPVRRRPDGYIPGIGAAPELMTAAFALRPEHPSDPRVHELPDGSFALIELLGREVPTDEELEPLVTEERQRLLLARRSAVEDGWVEAQRAELAESGQLVYDLSSLR